MQATDCKLAHCRQGLVCFKNPDNTEATYENRGVADPEHCVD